MWRTVVLWYWENKKVLPARGVPPRRNITCSPVRGGCPLLPGGRGDTPCPDRGAPLAGPGTGLLARPVTGGVPPRKDLEPEAGKELWTRDSGIPNSQQTDRLKTLPSRRTLYTGGKNRFFIHFCGFHSQPYITILTIHPMNRFAKKTPLFFLHLATTSS